VDTAIQNIMKTQLHWAIVFCSGRIQLRVESGQSLSNVGRVLGWAECSEAQQIETLYVRLRYRSAQITVLEGDYQ